MGDEDAYARAGVSQRQADEAVEALVAHLGRIDPGRPSRVVELPGHFASVVRIDEHTGVAFGTDGVGTKMVLAERLGRFDTIGIDCVAMNVNDLICVGAEPIALLDFILCADADPDVCGQIGVGLRRGAELAGVEIPGGEIAQVGDVVSGWELTASAIGLVSLEEIVTGARAEPGDALIGLPSSGLHSNGYTLARAALDEVPLDDWRLGRPLGDVLLEPTEIYVRAVLELLARRRRRPRARPHHRRRAQQPPAPGAGGRLRDRLTAAGAAGVRADPGAWRGLRAGDVRGLQHGPRLRLRRRGRRCRRRAGDAQQASSGRGPDRQRHRRRRACRATPGRRMKIAILIFDRLTALDAVGPYEVLSRLPGAELEFVAVEPGPKRTDTGALALIADRSLAEVAAPDVLLIRGGEGNRPLMEDETVLDWVRGAHAASTWTTSVCTGSLVLGAAGILEWGPRDHPLGVSRAPGRPRRRGRSPTGS